MALFLFAKAITEGRPIKLFNHGRMRRDFTYVADVTRVVLRLIDLRSGRIDARRPRAGAASTMSATTGRRS